MPAGNTEAIRRKINSARRFKSGAAPPSGKTFRIGAEAVVAWRTILAVERDDDKPADNGDK
ncbi:hypothetical protein SEEH1956_12146 [Salmonella enterica subsp. enterica serovar Hadar str. ATCC 51956]|nr:hypothetical protein SEEH1956_12146 [Salmonella enterica subsp. enterica serovar Hadar str. ATCC 51956]